MNRRFGAVAIVLMALAALAGVLSFVFFPSSSQRNQISNQSNSAEGNSSGTNSPVSQTAASSPSSPSSSKNSPGRSQPKEFKPLANDPKTGWKLLDWTVKLDSSRPKIQLRSSYYSAPGKFRFIRVEEEIQKDASGSLNILRRKEMVGDQIIVKLPDQTTQQKAEELAQKIGAKAASKPFAPDTWLFRFPPHLEAVPEGMAAAKSTGPIVEYTEPNIIVHSLKTPNDPSFNDFTLWHLYNNSQLNKDINAPKAWDRRPSAAYGTNKVTVAVIDCGVRYTHEDLAANMWRNPGETGTDNRGRNKATNGVDDDGDGWIDDVYGIDAYDSEDWFDSDYDAKKDFLEGFLYDGADKNSNNIVDLDVDPMPGTGTYDGHGTRCAGIIGAVGNNGVGTTGVAWGGVQLMALRFINNNSGSIADAILCIDYARNRGAKVINASYGQNGTNIAAEMEAIERARSKGVVFVAAAGNNNQSSDAIPFYPAAYTNRNIISVGATDTNDNKASFSNYGATNVDLMAPGVSIYSTEHGTDSSYGSGDGTSFAAPIVSGAVALLIAEYPTESADQIVARVVNTNAVDVLPSLSGKCVTGGRLNLSKLLPAADVSTLPPALVWHRPAYTEPLLLSPMRTPTNPVFSNTGLFYSGLKKFNNTNGVNTNGLVNQAGGWLFYRTSSAVSWASNALIWTTNNGDYQFWSATLSNLPVCTLQYYLQMDFDSGARTTFAYSSTNADGFATGTNSTSAQGAPFSFTVSKATASLTLSGTNQTYNGSARPVSVNTIPAGLTTTVAYNHSPSVPTNAGAYTVIATVNDTNYQGSATNTLTVAKAVALVSIGNTNQTYSGTARSVSVVTTPSGLSSLVTYNGLSSSPIDPGTYSILASVNELNYQGSGTATLQIAGVDNPTGDSNSNGVPNLLEYALLSSGTSTINNNPGGFVTQQSLNDPTNSLVSLVALVRTNDSRLSYLPQASLDLGGSNWVTTGFTTNIPSQTNVPTGFQRREYQFNAGTNPRAFLKLTVEQK